MVLALPMVSATAGAALAFGQSVVPLVSGLPLQLGWLRGEVGNGVELLFRHIRDVILI